MADATGGPGEGGSRLALVLGGGGSKGALQAGLYRAMHEVGIRPDLVVGTSVGALNGAFVAAGRDPDEMARGWAALTRSDLFGFNWRILVRGLAETSLFSPARLQALLDDRLPVRSFEDLPIPLHIVTTHMGLGEACVWSKGDVPRAVVASCAIPGILPPVFAHGGVPHIDGSLSDNIPIDTAFAKGATEVIAMNCRTCARCQPTVDGLASVLGAAFGIAADCKLRAMEEKYGADPSVLLLQPDLGEQIHALDFSHGPRLVREGYEYSLPRLRAWWEARQG
ncbi:MAG: patatin-like phospholipase family protein [Gemmatimonadota bacterium]|nr:patatin-like phospholipase family protein [Gemmatimonadota bacterium]